MSRLLLVLVAVLAFVTPGYAQDAARARSILEKACYRCHGKDGRNEGGFNYVLKRDKLVARKKLTPGDAAASKLLKRIQSGDMPPEREDGAVLPRLSADDIDVLKKWIAAGAADFDPSTTRREFITTAVMLKAIKDDLDRAADADRLFLRYFTLTHLYNAGLSDDELQSYRVGLSKLVNSLSWGPRIVNPQPIDAAKTVFRIDLRDLEWDAALWEHILAANPYGLTYTDAVATACYTMTRTSLPHVRGDWFVHAASRPPLYHDLLRLPRTDALLERRLQVDVAKNVGQAQVARAGFNGSGVSQNNRLLERHESSHGAYWKSYDFASSVGRKNLFEHPLGPVTNRSSFQHDGGEIIFNLPNGLQAYFLVDGKGNRIDKGPVNIVSDPKQKDRSVVNGISCMSCHSRGMIEKPDQVRGAVEKNAGSFTKEERDTILALYVPGEKFTALLKQDAERFAAAVKKTGAALGTTEPVAALALRFEEEVDLKLAAAEAGLTPEELLAGLKAWPQLARTLGPLRSEGGTIHREVFVAAFADMVEALKLGALARMGPGRYKKPLELRFPTTDKELVGVVKPKPQEGPLGMKFVTVPKGTFWMGGGGGVPGDRAASVEEFQIGIHEVTQGQWDALTKDEADFKGPPSAFSRPGRNGVEAERVKDFKDSELAQFPRENVGWNDVNLFIKKLNEQEKKSGWVYRLPTEAEWEYACRGGATSLEDSSYNFYFDDRLTNNLTPDRANFNGLSRDELTRRPESQPPGKYLNRTTAVGSYRPNRLGIYDMHGNVSEWCHGSALGEAPYPVYRGGAWNGNEMMLLPLMGHAPPKVKDPRRPGQFLPPDLAGPHYRGSPTIGFRLVRTPVR